MKIKAINEESLMLVFADEISEDNHLLVKAYYEALIEKGFLSVVPSYNAIMITYDFLTMNFYDVKAMIESLDVMIQKNNQKRVIKMPVCYAMGEDLSRVAKHTGLSEEEVIRRHSGRDYLVYMIGFTPGFPYLGGMDPQLETPRLEVPRTKIPPGAVGIGGKQTGIYPLMTPGGWNIIGRTPLQLYDAKESKTLLTMGDYIRFYDVSEENYNDICKRIEEGDYEIEVISC